MLFVIYFAFRATTPNHTKREIETRLNESFHFGEIEMELPFRYPEMENLH
jgi:hypothetical protein